jgi:hypothetical protein
MKISELIQFCRILVIVLGTAFAGATCVFDADKKLELIFKLIRI